MKKYTQEIDFKKEQTEGWSLLEELAREGARTMLKAALEEEIEIYVNKNVEVVSMPVKLTYTDDNNQEYQQTFMLELELYSEGDLKKYGLSENGASAWIYVLLILIIAGGAYYYFSKKKGKKKKA